MQLFFKKVQIFFLSFALVIGPFTGWLFQGGQGSHFEYWSAKQTFTRDYAIELEKDPERDFVILNLTDIQMKDDEAVGEMGELVRKNTDRIVQEIQPDLITLTGDNAWGTLAYLDLVDMMESYGIPWAPLMGNHDGQNSPGEFWCASQFAHAEHCLFRFGPFGMGYGNYIINITENGEIVHSIFMMDTHSDVIIENQNGKRGSYDHLWKNQMEWYSWAIDGIEKVAGKPVESTVMFHIPLVEYKTAWEEATGMTGSSGVVEVDYQGEYKDTSFGVRVENVCSPDSNNGFFSLLKEKGSTKNVLCGHDHVNNYSIVYEGIRLSYTLKDGPACYWEPNLNGGTTLTISSDGSAEVEHHFYDFPTE